MADLNHRVLFRVKQKWLRFLTAIEQPPDDTQQPLRSELLRLIVALQKLHDVHFSDPELEPPTTSHPYVRLDLSE